MNGAIWHDLECGSYAEDLSFNDASFDVVVALDDLHHHPLKSLTIDFAQDSFSPIPAFIDTGATLIDKSNVDALIEARKSASNSASALPSSWK